VLRTAATFYHRVNLAISAIKLTAVIDIWSAHTEYRASWRARCAVFNDNIGQRSSNRLPQVAQAVVRIGALSHRPLNPKGSTGFFKFTGD
jgi:hypothetical protein